MNFYLKVFGCQYNEWDAERIRFLLSNFELTETLEEKSADIYIILACAVRKTAVDRVYGMIKNWKGNKLIVAGCILDTDRKKLLQKNVFLWDATEGEELKKIIGIKSKKSTEGLLKEGNSNSPYVPIMIGCNNFCTYCAVPYTRGREASRPINDIVNDFKKVIKRGKKEIMLLGQNVNSYDDSLKFKFPYSKYSNDFAILLETLNNISGDFIIRFTSNHPKDMSDDIIAAVRDLPKVKKEIHLPIQSGSNKILKAMNRPYTKEQYLELVKKIKKEIPSVKILTDVIVGFPGETEKDFQETVDVFKKVGYHQSFTNKYSPREGTAAYKLGDPIPWEEKERRWRILNSLANKK